jgi:hypothetical protein
VAKADASCVQRAGNPSADGLCHLAGDLAARILSGEDPVILSTYELGLKLRIQVEEAVDLPGFF